MREFRIEVYGTIWATTGHLWYNMDRSNDFVAGLSVVWAFRAVHGTGVKDRKGRK